MAVALVAAPVCGQGPSIRYGAQVPSDVKLTYERGLKYLATTQQEDGSWAGGQTGGGITGLCLMAFLASGEDPNYGQYNVQVRRAVRSIIRSQNVSTGYIPNSMYHHGFACLALAEAYGTVNDSLVWDTNDAGKQRSIGEALELAVRCSITSQQKNPQGAWRYSPDARDADTSVAGAVMMGLLAARNAGIEVPDEVVDKAIKYFHSNTSDSGMVAYSGGIGGMGESMNRSSVATLVSAVGKRKESKEFKATLQHITSRLDHQESGHPFYFRYYMAQALFQGDFDAWTKWKEENIQIIRGMQQDDGSVPANYGPAYGTAMSLLSLALDFRFLPIYER
ncbi:MAG: squalene--hopene cyclase [Planctomycetales bacterium]|nr:squalene--hopene cyclase [Planctomycetales bacterium]